MESEIKKREFSFEEISEIRKGKLRYKQKRYLEAISYLLPYAYNSDASAYLLSECYQFGNGVPKDMKKAIQWCEVAAELDNTIALTKLGYCYLHGYHVEVDEKKGLAYYERAEKVLLEKIETSARGFGDLVYLYLDAATPKFDLKKAYQYAVRGCDVGCAKSTYALYYLYDKGIFVTKDKEKSKEYYELALKRGYVQENGKK